MSKDESKKKSDSITRHFTFVVLPGVSMMALSAAMETLRGANCLTHSQRYTWALVAPDAETVIAANGIPLSTVNLESVFSKSSYIIFCGGLKITKDQERRYLPVVRQAHRRCENIGSLSTGTHLLARAGLLNGYRCTIHWENFSAFKEEFPEIECTSALYEIDRGRLTCSGGVAAIDMMLHIVTRDFGEQLAIRIANQYHYESIRRGDTIQVGDKSDSIAALPQPVRAAIEIMSKNLEYPVSTTVIADHVGISLRSLERLFRKRFEKSAKRYYLELRTSHARELLMYTDMEVIDVAIASGFCSASHLASWYRRFYKILPSQERA